MQNRGETKPTALEVALEKARPLSDADLYRLAGRHTGTVAGCACLLELAKRKAAGRERS